MTDGSAPRITKGDEVRVYYGHVGNTTSFVEGVVSRFNVTTTRGRGFLIDITRDVLLGREQSVKPGYQHYVLYEQLEEFPEKVEVLSQAQREPDDHLEHGSGPQVEEEPEAETEAAPASEPETVFNPEQEGDELAVGSKAEADGSQRENEQQDGQRRGGRVISLFGWRK